MKYLQHSALVLLIGVALIFSGCATLQHVGLSPLNFSLQRVSSLQIAGIDVTRTKSVEELNMFQVARATLAVSRKNIPLNLTVHIQSENPVSNQIAAKLVNMDWTLILDGRRTISGVIDRPVTIPAGSSREIPLRLTLNLFDFFNDKSALDLLDLALAFAGEGGGIPRGVALEIHPTVDTPFGPIKYGRPFLIEAKQH